MAFNRPTLKELIDRIKNDFLTRLNGSSESLRFTLAKVFSVVLAGVFHLVYGFLAELIKQFFPTTATGEYLLRWLTFYNILPFEATFAIREIQFNGIDGNIIPINSSLKSESGIEYKTNTQVTITSGVALVEATAQTAGTVGNLDVGQILTLTSAIEGVNSEAEVTSSIEDAVDPELEESSRARLLARVQTPPAGGTEDDYVMWAKQVPGVTRAWAYGNIPEVGDVAITFLRDGDNDPIPSIGEVNAVQDYIDLKRPVTANPTVFQPIPLPVNFTIDITPDTAEIRAAITAELKDLIKRKGGPGATIYLSQIRESISISAGEEDNTVTVPSANVVAAFGEIHTFGAITWV